MGTQLVRGGFGWGLIEESRCSNLGSTRRPYLVLRMGPEPASGNLSAVGEMHREGRAHVAWFVCDGTGGAVGTRGERHTPPASLLFTMLSLIPGE